MTVNERLWAAGLFDEFYASVEKKDVLRIIEVLRSVELGSEDIKAILKSKGFEEGEQDEATINK